MIINNKNQSVQDFQQTRLTPKDTEFSQDTKDRVTLENEVPDIYLSKEKYAKLKDLIKLCEDETEKVFTCDETDKDIEKGAGKVGIAEEGFVPQTCAEIDKESGKVNSRIVKFYGDDEKKQIIRETFTYKKMEAETGDEVVAVAHTVETKEVIGDRQIQTKVTKESGTYFVDFPEESFYSVNEDTNISPERDKTTGYEKYKSNLFAEHKDVDGYDSITERAAYGSRKKH